jgi:hypothetical protein
MRNGPAPRLGPGAGLVLPADAMAELDAIGGPG